MAGWIEMVFASVQKTIHWFMWPSHQTLHWHPKYVWNFQSSTHKGNFCMHSKWSLWQLLSFCRWNLNNEIRFAVDAYIAIIAISINTPIGQGLPIYLFVFSFWNQLWLSQRYSWCPKQTMKTKILCLINCCKFLT